MGSCLLCASYWGPGLQPRDVPWLGIEPATLWFTSLCSIHWATPARATSTFMLTPYYLHYNKFWNQLLDISKLCSYSKLVWLFCVLGFCFGFFLLVFFLHFHVNFSITLLISQKKSSLGLDQGWIESIVHCGRTATLTILSFQHMNMGCLFIHLKL